MQKRFCVFLIAALPSLDTTVLASAVISAPDTIITTPPSPTVDLERRQVAGAPGTPILSTLRFAYTALPEQVYPFAVLRGPQSGYNICNSSTLGPNSLCQTLIFNGPDDFCLWGSDVQDGTIGNEEARVVAYCTKPDWGTRLIPQGMITGLQWMQTSAYIQVTGFINNQALNLDPSDTGGELDPHGADLQGNPLGGVVYSNSTPDSSGGQLAQVFNWNMFAGSGQFCFKACFNSITSPDYCENVYDLVGCNYNMPSDVQNGTFLSCQGDLQTPVGTYTSNGQTLTWSMPPTLTTSPPYTPNVPASSNCVPLTNDLFSASTTGPTTGTGSPSQTATGSSSSSGGSSGNSTSSSNTSSSTPSVRPTMSSLFIFIATTFAAATWIVL